MTRWILTGLLALGLAAAAIAEEPDEPEIGPEVGKQAPDFRLNDHEGRALRLSDHGKGHWTVIAFYPKAATPG